jgi:MFS superfamily sulfate permease-like transporter
MNELGRDQLAFFLTTLTVTLATDLLIGVAAGLALKVVFHLARGVPLAALVRPSFNAEVRGRELRIAFPHAATFCSLPGLRRRLRDVSAFDRVVVDFEGAAVVDHTFLERLEQMSEEWPHTKLEIVGLACLRAMSAHPTACRQKARS